MLAPSSPSETEEAPPLVSLAPYKGRHGCAIVMRSMTLPALQAVGRTACLYPLFFNPNVPTS